MKNVVVEKENREFDQFDFKMEISRKSFAKKSIDYLSSKNYILMLITIK